MTSFRISCMYDTLVTEMVKLVVLNFCLLLVQAKTRKIKKAYSNFGRTKPIAIIIGMTVFTICLCYGTIAQSIGCDACSTHGPFVYRLGHRVFIPARGVRLS